MNTQESTTKIAITPRKPGRPRAISQDRITEVICLYQSGLGYRAIARDLAMKGLLVDWSTVRRVIKSWLKSAEPPDQVKTSNSNTILPLGREHNVSKTS